MKQHYTDEELIHGLRQRKPSCIEYIYEEYYPVVRHLLHRGAGTQQDLEDIFQDTLTAVYMKCRDSEFQLSCSLKTYFVSVSKNLWMQRLERRRKIVYREDLSVHEAQAGYHDPFTARGAEREVELQRLFYKNLQKLPPECRRLLELYALRVPFREIARLMKYKDEACVKSRKYTCKILLREKIMNDPECQPYLNYE